MGEVIKYGMRFPALSDGSAIDDLSIELCSFVKRRSVERGGLGTYGHFKKITEMMWPDPPKGSKESPFMVWHSWKRDRIKALCDQKFNVWAGCAAAGKTYDAAHFAMVFFAADPMSTAVILTSTTGKMVRKRIWPAIQAHYQASPMFPGNMVDSKTMLQAQKGDDKHGIFALAVADGPVSKAVANIQGIHAKRMLVIIDEATDTPEAIFEALVNLQVGCSDFNVLAIGNPTSQLDAHGKFCEPVDGWNSISIEDDSWETRGVPEWGIGPGICLHFDGTKSPNIMLGEDKFPFLYTNKYLEVRARTPEIKNTIGSRS